jgi:hypothetical protein
MRTLIAAAVLAVSVPCSAEDGEPGLGAFEQLQAEYQRGGRAPDVLPGDAERRLEREAFNRNQEEFYGALCRLDPERCTRYLHELERNRLPEPPPTDACGFPRRPENGYRGACDPSPEELRQQRRLYERDRERRESRRGDDRRERRDDGRGERRRDRTPGRR